MSSITDVSQRPELLEDPKNENPKSDRKVQPYLGVRLVAIPKESMLQRIALSPDKREPGDVVLLNHWKDQSKDLDLISVGFKPESQTEVVMVETLRQIISKLYCKDVPVVSVPVRISSKPAEDPYAVDVCRFLIGKTIPKVVQGTSLERVYNEIFEGLRKFVLSGKRYQTANPRSQVNRREILIYDLIRYALRLAYADEKYRHQLWIKFPIDKRNMKLKGLHNPNRIKSVLTKTEYDTIMMDAEAKRAWDIQVEETQKIISGSQSGTLANAKASVVEANKRFTSAVPKAVLKIAYSRMKKRNSLIQTSRKAKGTRVSTPKLLYVLQQMIRRNDRFGYPNLIAIAVYREDFFSIYDQYVTPSVVEGGIHYEWKDPSIQSFQKLVEWCKDHPQLPTDSDSEPEVPEE